MTKERVDVLAYKQGLFETREQAKRGVMAGLVVAIANGQRFDKPGEKIDESMELKLKGEKLKYVSRGGLKLEKALQVFDISVEEQVTLDIGASTGGFTDVMLQNGAQQVYAVDVGIDVSFISLRLILPALHKVLAKNGEVVALIKPQFEAGREQIGKNGIVKDKKVHQAVLEKVTDFMVEAGFSVKGLDFSPIQGGHGNVEFLAHLEKRFHPENLVKTMITTVVETAHKEFKDE